MWSGVFQWTICIRRKIKFLAPLCYFQGLSIQRDNKHCINLADNKNYIVGTVPYLQTL